MILLRDYQEECIEGCREKIRQGETRSIINLPTGTGKTVTALSMVAGCVRKGNRALWLAHRDELISQAAAAWNAVAPDLPPASIVKADRNETAGPFVIASVQTLYREARLANIYPSSYRMCVYDEAHHACADKSIFILSKLDPTAYVIGLTATVERGDNISLASVFPGGIAYSLPLLKAIRDGHLVDFRPVTVDLGIDFDNVRCSKGDYVEEALAEEMSKVDVPGIVSRAIAENAAGRKGLIFTCTVRQAEQIAEAVPDCKAISYHTDDDTRYAILADFRKGIVRWIANCAVLTEGYDQPNVNCVCVVRATRSKSLYLQMLGRGLRTAEGKSDCLVLDFAGASTTHSPIQAPILFGIEGRLKSEEGCAEAAVREAGEKSARREDIDPLVKSLMGKKKAGSDDDWAHWVQLGDAGMPGIVGEAFAASGPNRMNVICWTRAESIDFEEIGEREPWYCAVWLDAGVVNLSPKPVWRDLAFGIGREMLRRANAKSFAAKDSAWRLRSPSEKLIAAAAKWGIHAGGIQHHEDGGFSVGVKDIGAKIMLAGDLSDALTNRIASSNLKAYLGHGGKTPKKATFSTDEALIDALKEQGKKKVHDIDSAVRDNRLGSMSDGDFDRISGFGRGTSFKARKILKIPAFKDQKEKIEFCWIDLLGKTSDSDISRKFNVRRDVVQKERESRGINDTFFVGSKIDKSALGTTTDGNLAKKFGCTKRTICQYRKDMGIPPFKAPKVAAFKSEEELRSALKIQGEKRT